MILRHAAILAAIGVSGAALVLAGASAAVARPAGAAAQRTPGAQLWVARYNSGGSRTDTARAVATSPDGAIIFVTGSSGRSARDVPDYETNAYAASSGNPLWFQRYGNPHGADDANAIATSPDGTKVFVTGSSLAANLSTYDYATVAYNFSTGAVLWVSRYEGSPSANFAYALAVSPDGSRVFVTGSSGFDYATVAYDASSGAELWTRRYAGSGRGAAANAIAVSPDGARVFVTGRSDGATNYDYLTAAYDSSTGAKQWVKAYNGAAGGEDIAHAIATSPDGTAVYVTGESAGVAPNTRDYATVAYTASGGQKLWAKRYDGPGGGEDVARGLAVTPDGARVIVTGSSLGSIDADYATVTYAAANGATDWKKRYDGPGTGGDYAYGLALSPDGSSAYVTGGLDDADYGTLAYDVATGAKLWSKRYHGFAAFDSAYAVAATASEVFVTGASYGASGGSDYATVAYSTS